MEKDFDNTCCSAIGMVRRCRAALRGVWQFYADGFRSMTLGRILWTLILIKVAILFLVFRLCFFHDILKRDYNTDEQRAQAVRNELIDRYN